jgi:2-isopropylmalate synthase
MRPEAVGLDGSRLVLGKHSGRHAFDARLAALGVRLGEGDAARAFESFKALCARRREVGDRELLRLARGTREEIAS